eukprot:Phypoly_transcript_18566.p1 GENE.Phypoly_transcript_18566~~Phypoly_transcript_18566.p1  ORF type:complete len:227 (+),score=14.75 Phypoly_transcript_18566:31-711(+)
MFAKMHALSSPGVEALRFVSSNNMESKPQTPLVPPPSAPLYSGYPTPTQQPTYNVLPSGQVQMIYNMPAGFVPPTYQYPYPAQHVYNQQPPQPQFIQYPTPMQPHVYTKQAPTDGMYIATAVTFYIGLFTFFPHLVSLILSFIMVNKGYVHGARKATVLTMAIIELFAWLFCVSFSWFYVYSCDYYSCYTVYWGWIAIVFWFIVALSCGIPRVIFLRNRATQYQHM